MSAIIWLASYPKSGNTWIRMFLRNYLSGQNQAADLNRPLLMESADGLKAHYRAANRGKDPEMTPAGLAPLRKQSHMFLANHCQGPVLAKTHSMLGINNDVPLLSMDYTGRAIYVVRNPVDVLPSFAAHYDLDLDEAIERMANDKLWTNEEHNLVPIHVSSWSRNVESWLVNKNDSLLDLRYEKMLADPKKEFRKVLQHLNIPVDKKRLALAVKWSSFKSLQQQEKSKGFGERYSKNDLFFRRGEAGKGKSDLTEDQIKHLLDDHGEWMQKAGYSTDLTSYIK